MNSKVKTISLRKLEKWQITTLLGQLGIIISKTQWLDKECHLNELI